MTDERQAVKTLAEQLVKAMKSVSTSTPSRNYTNGTTPSTISASRIVGLPAAFSSIINGVEYAAAGGDAVAQQMLVALQNIANGNFNTITVDTAMVERLYATFGKFINMVAENATIGDLDVETIRAGMGVIGLLTLSTADIEQAQIDHLSAENAFIRYGTGGKLYIDDLAVSNANIVNLAAGTVLINNSNGELVELYVDATTGDVSTRAVSYEGDDVIKRVQMVDEHGDPVYDEHGNPVYDGTLHGNRIVQNSITTDQLNASEIFAAQGTIMEIIADNINVTRLFANQGFISELETTIISSANIGDSIDLSANSSITMLQDSINLFSTNTSRTFVQGSSPFPVHLSDTWFDPVMNEHYVAAGITIPNQQMIFGHDDAGNLSNAYTEDYEFTINSDGELMVLIENEDLEDIVTENNIDFSVKEDGYLFASGLWNKIRNVAFSNLEISMKGVISEVFDSEKGTSRIEQNADRIIAIVSGREAVPYVKTNSIEIKEDLIEIKSSGNVDIKADNFSVSFNTEGSLPSRSRVDINNDVGIRVSDKYGGYFQANYNKIGLYDMLDTPRLYMDANGQAFFNGSLTLGGVRNTDGSLTIRNENGARILFANKDGMEIYDATGNTRQFYLDSSTGNATFSGELKAASGTFAGELSSSTVNSGSITVGGSDYGQIIIKNSSNAVTGTWGTGGFTLYNSNGTIPQIYLDGTTGNVIFAGNLSAACITSGTLSVDKITGLIEKDDWSIDFTNGTMAIGELAVSQITGSKSLGSNWGINFDTGTLSVGDISAATGTFSDTIQTNYTAMSKMGTEYTGSIKIGHDGFTLRASPTTNTSSVSEVSLNSNVMSVDYIGDTSHAYYTRLYSTGGVTFSGTGSFTGMLDALSSSDERSVRIYPNQMYFRDRSNNAWFSVTESGFSTTVTKSRLVKTDNYSDRLLYCYETPSPLFGDVGEGVISPDGQCYIPLDPIFAQTISTDQYQVFLQRYGEGDCYVSERHGSYFIVAGTPNLSFGWEIKAKQSDFDQLRLERNDEKFSVPDQTYGEDAAAHIQELYNERTQQDIQ